MTDGPKPEGRIIYNSSAKTYQFCDGTNWIAMMGAQGPTGPAGDGMWLDGVSAGDIHYSSGYVGIGTASPQTHLDVAGGLRLRQQPGEPSSAALIEMSDRRSTWVQPIIWNLYYDGSWKYRNSDYGALFGLDANGAFIFRTVPAGTAGNAAGISPGSTTRFFISNGGNVGIGTIAPSTKLDVNGAITASGAGGNVPHACTIRQASNTDNTTTVDVTCAAGEIIMSGGCAHNSNVNLRASLPLDETTWRCVWTTASPDSKTASGRCCQY